MVPGATSVAGLRIGVGRFGFPAHSRLVRRGGPQCAAVGYLGSLRGAGSALGAQA